MEGLIEVYTAVYKPVRCPRPHGINQYTSATNSHNVTEATPGCTAGLHDHTSPHMTPWSCPWNVIHVLCSVDGTINYIGLTRPKRHFFWKLLFLCVLSYQFQHFLLQHPIKTSFHWVSVFVLWFNFECLRLGSPWLMLLFMFIVRSSN